MRRAALALAAILVLTGATPGGRIVYDDFTANEQQHVFLERADGSGRVRLTHRPSYWTQPRWSPDGRRILTVHDGNIAVIAADGKVLRQLRAGGNNILHPRWSPDGTRIAYVVAHCYNGQDFSCGQLRVLRADGRGGRTLGPRYAVDTSQSLFTVFSWSPDGRRIVYQTRYGLVVVNVATGHRAPLGPRTGLIEAYPAWSPDGRSILFAKQRASGRDFDLVLSAPDGGRLRRIPGTFGAFEPRWSPDGTHIAYLVNRGQLWAAIVSRPDGSDRIRVTTSYDYQVLEWSPDSSGILVIGPGRGTTFALARADGSGKPVVIRGGDNPEWGP